MKKFQILGSVLVGVSVLLGMHNTEAAMPIDKAMQYAQAHEDDIHFHEQRVKDVYGEKNKNRLFSLMRANGLLHSGSTVVGTADRTLINFVINYGFANIPSEPYAYIRWAADLAGNPEKGYEPKNFYLVFADDYKMTFSLQGWEYRREFIRGLLVNSWAHNYNGRIKLDKFNLYEMYNHGEVVSAFMDYGDGSIKHFFYSGEKDVNAKKRFTRGIRHAMKLLEIDPNNMEAEYEARKKQLEAERLERLKAEVKKEIQDEQEREALKKQILAEMEAKKGAQDNNI